ncbi:hypothetical protein BCON_0184g00170 [Botryotinia convoluta]|uniref:Uncharacterized protein n=1 Tax=Botryotinia convoluta TaxID=54673 RepID=A0A4Z1HT84_9HELO|nr:hypothetical protein BCON_0184g00170 [Botryotinia convoluta]
MNPRRGCGARDTDFEEGEEGVETVFGDVGPGIEGGGEPADGDGNAEDDAPEDDGDEDGVADDGAVVEGVQGLERAGKAREQGDAAAGVGEGVEGGEEKVEGYAPVAEDCGVVSMEGFLGERRGKRTGEIREAESCGCASVGQSSYFPKDGEEKDEKCIERLD